MTTQFERSTLGVRAGQVRTEFQEHSEALFLTSSFVFENAAQAASRFTGSGDGFVYSRFTNPTVSMFQDRLAALEGAATCVATASGMSAILTASMALLKAGDHVVCSNAVFGATVQVVDVDDGSEARYQIVGEDEADIKNGLLTIRSPIARALISKKTGDTVEVTTPRGKRAYEIVAVAYI